MTAKQWRAYKQDYLIRVTDLVTTSILQQHSVDTARTHYLNGTESITGSEMSNYFESINKFILFKEDDSDQLTSIAVGKCKQPDHPSTNDKLPSAIKVDCSTPEGCLFCSKFAIHADKTDIRKLCSFRYVILETKGLSTSEAHFTSIFGEVLNRIKIILLAISEKSQTLSDLVESISSDVDNNENLDPYWEMKLNLLQEIELI